MPIHLVQGPSYATDAIVYLYWIYSTMDHFRTVGISRFQFWLILQICNCKDVIELTFILYLKKTNFFQNKINKNMRQFGVAHEI